MTKFLTTFLAALLLCLAVAVNAAAYGGIVSVDTVEAQPGDRFTANVWLTNNTIDIAGINCPLQFDNQFLAVDSVSFVGTIDAGSLTPSAAFDQTEGTIRIAYLPSFPVSTINFTSGLLAKIYFHLDVSADPVTIPVDSVNKDSIIGVDPQGNPLHLWYRIEVADASGENVFLPEFIPGAVVAKVPTAVGDDIGSALPNQFALNQNYPNPFNPTTTISFDLPQAGSVRLEIYNVLGQSVGTLASGRFSAGRHEVEFDASAQPSGIYFYRLTYPEGVLTRKMVLIK